MKKTRTKLTGKSVKNAVDVIKAEAENLKKNPPRSPWSKMPVDHPVLKVFIIDQNSPGSNFYDVNPVQWYLDKDEKDFVWKSAHPCNRRIMIPPVLEEADLDKVPGFLTNLASACGLDHEVLVEDASRIVSSHTVLCPLRDQRIKGSEVTLETAGLPPSTFLLLPGHPDKCGMVAAFSYGYDAPLLYGITIFSLPRVVRIVSKSSKGMIKA